MVTVIASLCHAEVVTATGRIYRYMEKNVPVKGSHSMSKAFVNSIKKTSAKGILSPPNEIPRVLVTVTSI